MDILEKKKIIICKQNAARTAVEQSADAGPTFKEGRATTQELCYKDLIVTNVVLYSTIKEKIAEAKQTYGLNLGRKETLVIKSLSVMPDVLSKSATVQNLIQGFIINGMLDAATNTFPDFDAMVQTLNRHVSKNEEELLKNTFFSLMDCQMEYGFIPEEFFDFYGYPVDRDDEGKVYSKHGVCESYQRAKNLGHPYTRKYRVIQYKKEDMKVLEKKKKKIDNLKELLNDNIIAETQLKEVMIKRSINITNDNWLEHAILDDFNNSKVHKKKLASFCHVRKFDNAERGTKKEIPSKKKEVSEMAYSLCTEPIKLKLPIDTEEVLATYEDIQKEIQDETDSEEN